MDKSKNIQTVQKMYEDFGKGNIQAIVDVVADDVDWNDAGYPDLPFGSRHRTKKEIPGFFKILADSVNYTKFEPREFIADGNSVVATGYHEGTTKPKNVPFGHDWVMVWKFNENGKVKYVQSFLDTHAVAKGF